MNRKEKQRRRELVEEMGKRRQIAPSRRLSDFDRLRGSLYDGSPSPSSSKPIPKRAYGRSNSSINSNNTNGESTKVDQFGNATIISSRYYSGTYNTSGWISGSTSNTITLGNNTTASDEVVEDENIGG